MPIDPDKALGAALPEQSFAWTASDVLLYHLAVGAGRRPGDANDPAALRLTLDDDHLQVLPSFGVVAPSFHEAEPPVLELPGCDIDLAQVLHGSQSIRLHRPIPASGEALLRPVITGVWDKGRAAVIVQEGTAVDAGGEPLWTVTSSLFVRGEGGWGGDRGPSATATRPERAPDASATFEVAEEQALLYRLCGDRNPLHADPAFARRAGYPGPILHGLCTYGITLREVTRMLLGGDAGRVGGFRARFAGLVFPGETLRVDAWDEGDLIQVAATIAGGDRDGSPALADCLVEKL